LRILTFEPSLSVWRTADNFDLLTRADQREDMARFIDAPRAERLQGMDARRPYGEG